MSAEEKKKKGGARPGAGRRKKEKPVDLDARSAAGKKRITRIIEALNQAPKIVKLPDGTKVHVDDDYEISQFRKIDDAGVRESLDLRKWLYDKEDGKAVQTVNHLHDKPIEHNVTMSLGEGMRLAMKKADLRVLNRPKS